MATNKSIKIWRGDTFTQTYRFKSGGNLQDLTGVTLNFTMYYNKTSVNKVLSVADAASGEATLNLSPTETAAIPLGGIATYELDWTLGEYNTTLLAGRIVAEGQARG